MKYIIIQLCFPLIVFILLLDKPAIGQRRVIDSLENILKTAPKDISRVHLLYQIALQYSHYEGNSQSTQAYIEETCEWAHALQYQLGQAFCWDIRGVSFRDAGLYNQALEYHNRALRIGKSVGEKEAVATFHNNIGVVYRRTTNYQNALFHHLAALRIAESINHEHNIAVAVNSIGNIYISLNKPQEALQYFNRALGLAKASKNQLGMAINLNNIGYVYQMLEKYEEAEKYFTQSLEVNRQLNNDRGIAICYNDLGNIKKLTGQPDEALTYYSQALEKHEKIGDKNYISENYNLIGIIYANQKKYPQAVNYLQKGLQMALDIGAKNHIEVSYENLSSVYEQTGNYKQALDAYQKATVYKDSSLNETNASYIAQLQANFDSEKKESRIQMLEHERVVKEAELRQRRMIELALAGGLVFTLILFISIYQRNAHKKQINRLLHEQNNEIMQQKEEITHKNQELLALNEEKNHLIGIVAHDLRSPLSRIHGLASVLRMSMENLTTEQLQYLAHIETNSEQLSRMIAQILDLEAIESRQINLHLSQVNVDELLREIKVNLNEKAIRKNIQVEYQCFTQYPYAYLDKGYATQVFENVLSNAIKFSSLHSKIWIRVKSSAGNLRIEIKDSGPGISAQEMPLLFEKFQKLSARPTAGEASVGLGLSIVKKYVDAMKGRVWCESEPGMGAIFFLEFQLADTLIPKVDPTALIPVK